MPSEQKPFRSSDVRALFELAGVPFAVVRYRQQAVIFAQGDECDSVMHIEAGRVRLAVASRSGKEAICGLLGTGAFLGEEALGDRAVRRETATAMTATELLVVARAQMIELLRSQPVLLDRFIAHVVTRHNTLESDLADQLLNSSEQRLARALLVLAGCDERRPGRCSMPKVSQEIIAEMVGTTRSRVNAFMGKFRKLGLLEADGGVLRVTPSLRRLAIDGLRSVPPGAFRASPDAPRCDDEAPLSGGTVTSAQRLGHRSHQRMRREPRQEALAHLLERRRA